VSPESPPPSARDGDKPDSPLPRRNTSRVLTLLAGVIALAVLAGVALVWGSSTEPDLPPPDRRPGASTPPPTAARPTPTHDLAAARTEAVTALLAQRAQAVLTGDPVAWQSVVDPVEGEFAERQRTLIDRLSALPFAEWGYELVGEGPALPEPRAAALPEGSAIVRVRLTYRIDGTSNRTDREQWLTVVPRGGRWLIAGDEDGAEAGFETQRDLWDLGPVRLERGEQATVLADRHAGGDDVLRRLVEEADTAVAQVDAVWRGEWGRRPVVVLPRTQQDMATLIGDDDGGLAQIAAVTTGAFEEGLSRGDRIVINPDTFATLASVGRQVVLTHEMTHVATRTSTVIAPPIWLSEGFADYVAYAPAQVATGIIAGNVLDRARAGKAPRQLPEESDFDAGQRNVSIAYESAWLACRMLAQRFGERDLVRFYEAMSDNEGPGWPAEAETVLGLTPEQLTREWRAYVKDLAAA